MRTRLTRALCALGVLLSPVVGYADRVDCKGSPHWNSDHTYKKGDKAWHAEGGESYYLYKCDQEKCQGAGSSEPRSGSTVWKLDGVCKDDPRK